MHLAREAIDVGIVTTNMEAMSRFYRDGLGFLPDPPVSQPGVGTIHRFRAGQSYLRLLEPERAPTPSAGPGPAVASATGIRYLTLTVTDLADVVEGCRRAGAVVAREPREVRPGLLIATVQDPDGNWIELQSA